MAEEAMSNEEVIALLQLYSDSLGCSLNVRGSGVFEYCVALHSDAYGNVVVIGYSNARQTIAHAKGFIDGWVMRSRL